MVRVKMMRGNEVAIIADGKSYLFDLGGRCVSEDAGNLVSYMDGALDLPIVSVLTSPDYYELGVVWPGVAGIVRYKSSMDSLTLLGTMQMVHGFIKMLRRSGKQGDTRFNQIVFIYPEGYDLNGLLTRLMATKISEV